MDPAESIDEAQRARNGGGAEEPTREVIESDPGKLGTAKPFRLDPERSDEPLARTILVVAMSLILIVDLVGLLILSVVMQSSGEVIAAYSSASAPFLTLATAAITYYFTQRRGYNTLRQRSWAARPAARETLTARRRAARQPDRQSGRCTTARLVTAFIESIEN